MGKKTPTVSDVCESYNAQQEALIWKVTESVVNKSVTVDSEALKATVASMSEPQKTVMYAIVGKTITNVEHNGLDFAKAELEKVGDLYAYLTM